MKVAAVVTEYRGRCHAQQLIDRLLWGYGWDGKHHKPAIEVVALYTDQVGEGDVSRGWGVSRRWSRCTRGRYGWKRRIWMCGMKDRESRYFGGGD